MDADLFTPLKRPTNKNTRKRNNELETKRVKKKQKLVKGGFRSGAIDDDECSDDSDFVEKPQYRQTKEKKKKTKTKKKKKKRTGTKTKKKAKTSAKKKKKEEEEKELPPLPPSVLVDLDELSSRPKAAVEDLLRRCDGDLRGLSGRTKVVVEMLSELVQAGHTVCGGAIADYLRGKIHAAGDLDVDVDVPGKQLNFYEAFNLLDERLHGKFPQSWPEAYNLKTQPQRDPKSFLDIEHRRGSNDGSVREIVYEKDGEKVTVQLVHFARFARHFCLDAMSLEVVKNVETGEAELRTRRGDGGGMVAVDEMLGRILKSEGVLRRSRAWASTYRYCKKKEARGWKIDYSQVKDWPKEYVPPREAKTADKVFPQEYGVNAKRVLARTNSEKCAQEAKWIRDFITHVEEVYNPSVAAEHRLFVAKCFESSEADVCVTLKGQDTRLDDEHKSLDIRCKKKHWVGLQVKTGSVTVRRKEEGGWEYLDFNSVNNYKEVIALVCASMEQAGEVFYFPSAPMVEDFSGPSNLAIPVIPKTKKTKKMYGRLRNEFGVTYATLPSLLFQLFNDHKQSGKLMTWEEVNQPRESTGKTQLAELNAHLALFRNCVKVGLPVPICPDIDGRSFDWTWQGKTVQAKSCDVRKSNARVACTQNLMGGKNKKGKSRFATSYGFFDFLYSPVGEKEFALIPKEIMRRHGSFLGQVPVNRTAKEHRDVGRQNLYLYPKRFTPSQEQTRAWQKLHARYIVSWESKRVKKDVLAILNKSS